MTGVVVVLDASVGVKWFKDEAGSADARALLDAHERGELTVAVPIGFVYEILDVARRTKGIVYAEELWSYLSSADIEVVSTGLVEPSLRWARDLGCTIYDGAAPALADALDSPLVSADRAAHGRVPGVRILE